MYKRSISFAIAAKRKGPLIISLRLRHKASSQNDESESRIAVSDVEKFIDSSPEYYQLKGKLPKSLLKKFKTPESMYLINNKTAQLITKAIIGHLNNASPLIEVNPGLGILTKELLQCQKNHIYTYETLNHFAPYLQVSMIVQ